MYFCSNEIPKIMSELTKVMRLIRFLGIMVLLNLLSLEAGVANHYFYVQFSDKNNSSYSLVNPTAYLSERALARRADFGLVCDSTDLPVNPDYISQVANLGVTVHSRTKWLNGITVLVNDSAIMNQVRALPFVKFVQFTGLKERPRSAPAKIKSETQDVNYGTAVTQINQLNGFPLHNLGYTGKGIHIGVLDGGFMNVNTNPAFDSLRLQGRLLGVKDVILPGNNVYAEDAHGANVLSIIAGNMPGYYTGSAPHASFWLIRSEFGPTEYLVETDFWVSGIEYADSVGVDIINSSLGYSVFDDAAMNFSYTDMNGQVSRASRAAGIASKKGIIVCNSAGNEGNKDWRYITSPADADGIIAVGAATSEGVQSVFSSFGPSSDGRVKPEVTAMGTATALVNTNGTRVEGNGTSYSSPLIAGMMACLLQALKTQPPPYQISTILQSVFRSGNSYLTPNNMTGYGIPNFQTALGSLLTSNQWIPFGTKNARVSFQPALGAVHVRLAAYDERFPALIQVYSVTGTLILSKTATEVEIYFPAKHFTSGIYAVRVSGNGFSETHKLIVN